MFLWGGLSTSVVQATNSYLSGQEWSTWLTAALAATATLSVFSARYVQLGWLMLAGILVVTAVPELLRNVFAFGWNGLGINLTGLPGNSNVLGVLLAACFPAVAASITDARDRRYGLLVLPLLLTGLLLTFSRNAWLTTLAGFTVWWFLAFRGQRVKLLAVLTVGLLVLLAIPASRARLHAFIDPQHPSNAERADLWRAAITLVMIDEGEEICDGTPDYLWWGFGPGQMGFLYPMVASLDKWQLHSHNVFSEWLVGGGVPLLELGVCFILSGVWRSGAWRAADDGAIRAAQMLVVLLANQFDYLLWIPLTAYVFFLVFLRRAEQSLPLLTVSGLGVLLCIAGLHFAANVWISGAIFGLALVVCRLRRILLCIAGVVLIVVVGIVPLAAYTAYATGVRLAATGQWRLAAQKFSRAVSRDGTHPVYRYYAMLAKWRGFGNKPDFDDWRHITDLHDPYMRYQFQLLRGDTCAMNYLSRRAPFDDPQQMIIGGVEFPQVPLVPCSPSEQLSDWRDRPEGSLLNCARNWSDSWPAAAQEAFRLALRKDVRSSPTYRYYAEFLQARQRWREIIDELTPALAVGGKRPEDTAIICAALAAAHAALGDGAQAAQLQRAAQRARDNMVTRHAQVIRMMFHIPTLPREGFNDN